MSLVNICLETIVNNFERYYLAFSTSEDVTVKRLFEFLQKKYSHEIIERLYDDFQIEEKYIDFLINKYSRTVDTGWFANCSWAIITAKFSEFGSNIKSIHFNNTFFEEKHSETSRWQDIICYLPNLEQFTCEGEGDDVLCKNLATFCPNILEINLGYSCITNEGIKQLCIKENGKTSCSKLKRLHIYSSSVNDEGMKYLIKNLPSLEHINYAELPQVLYSLHHSDLPNLDKVAPYRLTELNLLNYAYSTFFPDLLKICLCLCPHLKSLTCPLMSEENLDVFSKLVTLEELHLECHMNSEINMNNFLKFNGRKLTSLRISNCTVSVSVLAESCPNLTRLCFNKISFLCEEDFKHQFHCLVSCTFRYPINDSSTGKAINLFLSSSPKLESIAFEGYCFSDSEMKISILKCCEQCCLIDISFIVCVIDMEFMKDVLLNCHSLKCVRLDGCDFLMDEEEELSRFAEILPNNPEIYFKGNGSLSDDDDDVYLNDLDDEIDSEDYDDFYPGHYDFDEEYDDDDDYYGYYFEV